MTLLEILKKTTDYFASKGVDSPRLSAELILGHALNLTRMDLYLNFDRPLTETELALCREPVRRRGAREPLQYVTGRAAFRELTFAVRPGVLIPRPETESLVDSFLNDALPEGARVLDAGTGSGAIALSVKKERPALSVTACDISDEALAVARANGEACGLKVEWVLSDLFSSLDGMIFRAVVSNPPYIPSAELDTLQPEVKAHEPRLALDGGPDGLAVYRRLFAGAAEALEPGGRVYLEHGDAQGPQVRALGESAGLTFVRADRDLTGKARIVVMERP